MRRTASGNPEPLGVTPVPGGVNVAIHSAHATAIELCLFDAAGEAEVERVALPGRTGDVHHAFVADVAAGDRYGLRAHGPYEPGSGHRFNPAKLLIDPYARALDRKPAFHPSMVGGGDERGERDPTDSAPFVPKTVVTPVPPRVHPRRPRVAWADTVVYEVHVRGFTREHSEIPHAIRGTCAGLAHPAAIAHLTRLGITTLELMPIASAIEEPHLARLGLVNYWGYNPAAMFVPDPALAPGGIDELAACVAALQAAGIEVILDVVLNHTGEGDARGPTISLRGLDNLSYYRTDPENRARYVDDTGCGHALALDRSAGLRLAMDVLRYYADVAGVDGFRFDLATTLARRDDGFDPAAPLLQAIAQDPSLRDLKLIAEPWDIGIGGHRLGAFPPAWGEWNDRYRDTVRRYWRGDTGLVGDFATRFAGSGDVFAPRSRPPSRSVNFVAAHDGFTLADLVSFAAKHNEANGEGNRDGTDANYSWNHGVDGGSVDPGVAALRRRDVQNLLATLLLSRGTPMLAMGDELGRSQHGNNNAYAQDNALTWVDWEHADHVRVEQVAALIALRKRHPALRSDRWLTGTPDDAGRIPDVEWRRPDGRAMGGDDWASAANHALVAALYADASESHQADRVAIAFNAGADAIDVRWPDPRDGYAWHVELDTSKPDAAPGGEAEATATVAPRSLVVMTEALAAPSGVRAQRSVEPEALARLASAAGIAADWWTVGGERHVVSPDTQHAILAAMGLGVSSTDEARERLIEIADGRERRPLPPIVIAHGNAEPSVALVLDDAAPGTRATLELVREDGASEHIDVVAGDLPTRTLHAADGRAVVQHLLRMPALPEGIHTLRLDGRHDAPCRVVVAPERCFLPPEVRAGARRFGLAAHLYALRRRGDFGIGDFTALSVAAEATAQAGGSIVGINPLHALFAGDRERASPYHPSDRRFLDPIYIDIERVPDLADAPAARALLERDALAIARLSARASIDYPAVWAIKRSILEACYARFVDRPASDPHVVEFERYVSAAGASLRQFALFETLAALKPGEPWHRWPNEFRDPSTAGVADFARRHPQRIRFACYLQWLADRQLAAASEHARASGLALGFFRDLAIGAAPDGAELWSNPGAYAAGVTIGAPPDAFATAGQSWSLPPPNPWSMLASGCAGFRELVAANMQHAGALRLDHVMGLARLFWIPEGAPASAGAYVHYPLETLLGCLALESERARCLLVGEALGTVPEGFRERLAAADILSYGVLWFEREGVRFVKPSRWPARAAACVSTHDLPTIAGWWSGVDLDERRAVGSLDDDAAIEAYAERLASKAALVEALREAGAAEATAFDATARHDVEITAAIHRFVGGAASSLVMIQADDLSGETMALNLPGTDRGRPNWRRRLKVDVAELWKTDAGMRASADLAWVRAAR